MAKKEKALQEDPQEEQEVLDVEEEMLDDASKEEAPIDFTKWDFGHLTMKCSRCGYDDILQEDIEDGIMFTIPTTDKHNLILECPQCKTTVSLYWRESDKKKPLEVKEDETVQEESKEE